MTDPEGAHQRIEDLHYGFRMPIGDSLDLHTFQPSEIKCLMEDYLEEATRHGYREVWIIHGKGQGILRQRVRSILAKHPLVLEFQNAHQRSGGWGATHVLLKGKGKTNPIHKHFPDSRSHTRNLSQFLIALVMTVILGLFIFIFVIP